MPKTTDILHEDLCKFEHMAATATHNGDGVICEIGSEAEETAEHRAQSTVHA